MYGVMGYIFSFAITMTIWTRFLLQRHIMNVLILGVVGYCHYCNVMLLTSDYIKTAKRTNINFSVRSGIT